MVQTLQPGALAVIVLFPSVSTIVVGLRVYCRALFRQFYWDDALIIIALAFAIAEACCLWVYAKVTWQGYHYYDMPDFTTAQRVHGSKFDLANQLLYPPIVRCPEVLISNMPLADVDVSCILSNALSSSSSFDSRIVVGLSSLPSKAVSH
jgi:hypothetical protein